jgi:hypothetical protein
MEMKKFLIPFLILWPMFSSFHRPAIFYAVTMTLPSGRILKRVSSLALLAGSIPAKSGCRTKERARSRTSRAFAVSSGMS